MLSMLGFQTAPIPFGRKPHTESQKHSNMPFMSRAKTAQSQQRASQSGSTYYVFSSSGSFVLESQRPPVVHAGQTVPAGHAQPNSAPKVSTVTQQVVTAGGRNRNSSGRSYNIYPDGPHPDSFVYERSEVDSDTLTLYSNSSADTLQLPNPGPLPQASKASPARHEQVEPDSPHPLPISLPSSSSSLAVVPQGRPLPRNKENSSRPRSGSGDSGSSRRRSIGSDHERPVISQVGLSPTRSSPTHTSPGGRFPEQASVPLNAGSGPRDVPLARRDSDPSVQADATRKRRLSGAVIPTGFGVLPGERLTPAIGREASTIVPAGLGTSDRHSPPILRGPPSPDSKRERYSPEREVSPASTSLMRDRRASGAGVNGFTAPPPGSFYDRDRPPLRRGSQSSNSSSTSRERHSPQDEAPHDGGFVTGPVPVIRSRTLSQGRIPRDAPRQIFVAGLETSKMVRFSENLICPSPIPLEKRRRGWFNKRGDQLWTNDGVYVAPDPGFDYPLDLSEYPEPGNGWQNEEGIRIDMQHRLVPKVPLRPALKRGSSSATSQSQLQQSFPRTDNRPSLTSTSIREEA